MARIAQPKATRGSQYWLQVLVETEPDRLAPPGLPPLHWLSPRADDEYAEYRDGAFLDRLGLSEHAEALAGFWPGRGPVWDGLARASDVVVLVEAKAHVAEAISPPSAARSKASQARIAAAFGLVKQALGANDRSDWSRCFYQFANRLAHLWWPQCARDLGGALCGGGSCAGLASRHGLRGAIHDVHPDVSGRVAG